MGGATQVDGTPEIAIGRSDKNKRIHGRTASDIRTPKSPLFLSFCTSQIVAIEGLVGMQRSWWLTPNDRLTVCMQDAMSQHKTGLSSFVSPLSDSPKFSITGPPKAPSCLSHSQRQRPRPAGSISVIICWRLLSQYARSLIQILGPIKFQYSLRKGM